MNVLFVCSVVKKMEILAHKKTEMNRFRVSLNYLLNASPAAVVCYSADRNELRSRVIQWLQTEVVPDGWFVKGSNFSDILLKYFKVWLLFSGRNRMDTGLH